MTSTGQTNHDQALFACELRKLFLNCGTNKHEHVIVGIKACIEHGLVRGRDIIQLLKLTGLNSKHVGLILTQDCGPSPERHHWWRDADGHYHLHM